MSNFPAAYPSKIAGENGHTLFARFQMRKAAFSAYLLCAPALVVLLFIYLGPIVQTLMCSFATQGAWYENYARLFSTDIYWQSFVITFRISAIVTLVCLVLGYPVAIWLTRLTARRRAIAFAFILVPFWTSALVRTYAWTVILQKRGLINVTLKTFGLIDTPLTLSYTTLGTIIGNVHILLPAMILTLYAVLSRIDISLINAARSLGARPVLAFLRIYLPLSLPAIIAGSTLTFVASLGSYIIPALLGGREDLFVAQLIDQQVSKLLNVGFASAIAMVLLVLCLILCVAYARFMERGERRSGTNGALVVKSSSWRLSSYAALVLLFLVLPTFVLIPLSFSSARYQTFPPPGYSLQWYQAYLGNPAWQEATFRSLRIALAAAIGAAILGTLAALGMSRMSRLSRYIFTGLMLSPLLIPNIIFALGLYQLYSALGLIGTETGLAMAHMVLGLPYVIITVSAALSARDHHLAVAARSLGAGPVKVFRFIQFPLLRNAILAGGFLAFIASFDEVLIAIFISGARTATLPKMMWDGVTTEVNPIISAVSVVVISISLLAMLLMNLLQPRKEGSSK
ncbi:ABC-type spermidine/putrescine transport system permease subunit I [Ochrobactrum intermedium]|uniref:ABC-type spermidine/putrescine transport system permease subunit I n=2 Tax=Brucella intermedia TaxID=94625 RepID=A0ABR6AUB1_9HYPH|nr:ABC transporter permease subunit [Brucella intermedia]MBA8852801.1 ABC-type spermidine/putrescine transport system permease subunit I [Brucella intermedia]MDH0125944.1 ABC transporter permease subunit [Brucella intermedia GD04153]NYD80433.1 ABC-type spermidine/putrescine transport system permease subunit I [Brucella intermedia]